MTLASQTIRQRIQKALASQKQPSVTVLSSLLAAQDELGYLPNEAVEEVARSTDASINDVWGVASFYMNFRFTPPTKHLVEVCWGPTCHLLGAGAVLKQVLDYLGLSGEGDTEDGKVTVKYNTCMGACSQGPGISIDHRLYSRMTPDRAVRLLADMMNGDL